jgi:hypothetical protein
LIAARNSVSVSANSVACARRSSKIPIFSGSLGDGFFGNALGNRFCSFPMVNTTGSTGFDLTATGAAAGRAGRGGRGGLATGFETGVEVRLEAGLEAGLAACAEAGLCSGFATGFDCARFACFSFSNCCFNTASCSKPIAHDQASKASILAARRSRRSAGSGRRDNLQPIAASVDADNRNKTAVGGRSTVWRSQDGICPPRTLSKPSNRALGASTAATSSIAHSEISVPSRARN